jgi:4-hydroxybenzoate polyprenyltransferase
MRLLAAFLKLVRLPNLIFILLTQLLFQYAIYRPMYGGQETNDTLQFIFLVLASLSIAAAGYIINDYFDINIDEVNKPRKMVVDRVINRRWAIAWHLMLSFAGIVFTVLAMPSWSKWYIIAANIACIALLWFYSTSFKRQLLVGNIVISLLTSWTILVVFFSKFTLADAFGGSYDGNQKLFRFTLLYAGFAFIISLIREAIKDMEDLPGDQKFGCHTMPIVWGVNATKVYTAVWLVVLIAALVIVQVYVLQFRWWLPVAYSVPLIIIPLVLVLLKLKKTNNPEGFHKLSNITKFVMFTGILSMLFFYFYL